MDAGLIAQYVIVAVAVAASFAFVLRRQFPAGVRRLRIACAVPLVREQRAPWIRRIGHWVAPRATASVHACGACDGCDP